MPAESNGRKELSSTYMVQNRSDKDEMERLRIQNQLFTEHMGGVLPEQADPLRFQSVLDVGCGTGGWLIELARMYPHITTLVGIDISARMIDYANRQAAIQGVADRIQFRVQDALHMSDMPGNSFDLVNHRFNFSYLRTWDWPNLLHEYQRLAHAGGVIRVTEGDLFYDSTSDALNTLAHLGKDAFWKAGHFFKLELQGVTSVLPDILRQQGLADVQTRIVPTEYINGNPSFPAFFEDIRLVFRTIAPFLRKWATVPDNYDQIYQQALADMQQPGFRAVGQLVTVWGKNTRKSDYGLLVE